MDKAATLKGIGEAGCELKSHSLDNIGSDKIGSGILFTYRVTQDGKCGDDVLPTNSWIATYFVKEGDTWKPIYHMETGVPTAKAEDKKDEAKEEDKEDADAEPEKS